MPTHKLGELTNSVLEVANEVVPRLVDMASG